MPDTFISDCIEGRATPEQIHEYISHWHDSNTALPLCHYLGMSQQQYADFVQDESALQRIVYAYREPVTK